MVNQAWDRIRFLDTETTGVVTTRDRVVTATVGCATPDGVDDRQWLIAVDIPIPAEATTIHGITTDHARSHGTPPALAVADILDALSDLWNRGIPVAVMNARFDLSLLAAEAARHDLPMPHGPVVDPSVLDKKADKYRRGRRRLTDLCDHYQVKLGSAHDSREDALAAARLVWRMLRVYPHLAEMTPPPELHTAQIEWAKEQSADRAAWHLSTGNPERVRMGWPVDLT